MLCLCVGAFLLHVYVYALRDDGYARVVIEHAGKYALTALPT